MISAENKTVQSATITLNNGQKITTSNSDGYYEFTNLSEGVYEIVVTGVAFQSAKKVILLGENSNYTLNFDLTNFQNNFKK